MDDKTSFERSLSALRSDGPLSRLFADLPCVVSIDSTEPDPRTLFVSEQIETLLGYTPGEWSSDRTLRDTAVHPADRERVLAERTRAIGEGEPYAIEYRMLSRDGRELRVRELSEPLTGPYRRSLIIDRTNELRLETRMKEAEGQFQTLVEHLPAVLYVEPPSVSDRASYVSPQSTEILGVSPEDWVADATFWETHLHPDDKDHVLEEYERFTQTGQPDVSEYRMVRPDGRVIWIYEVSMIVRDDDGEPILIQGALFDITQRKEAEENIAFLAYHDPLTGLANRKLFEEILEPALARARRQDLAVAVLFMDLDNFKQVNDSLGHHLGDSLLTQVAERLREATRDTDLVARQGGDEFLVLIPDIETEGHADTDDDREWAVRVAETMAERIHRSMRAPFGLGDHEISTSMSIGISVFPLDAQDAMSLLKNSDAAMYQSKRARPGNFAFSPSPETDPLVELSMTRRLREAVKGRHWVLHYQPMVDLGTKRIRGVEALLRWRRPKGELVPAADFIAVAEEMGVMEVIGDWVIEEICSQARAWSAEGLEPDVSFNLSPRQLWHRDLARILADSFGEAGIDSSRIVVEVSETTATTDPARAQRVLQGLRDRGIRIAIDDFGTGYSPPGRLRNLPIDILKIDQPLVRDLPQDVEVGGFVEAVISFASGLDIECLAEGIETEEQRAFLLEKGCHLGQGYLFSRPVSGQEMTELLKGFATPDAPGSR